VIDLRSDTVTLPTQPMRAAMAVAEVGDDVYGEDPSIHELEHLAAHLTGKRAAMYVPSGTMGNLCAHLAHTQPGQEVICGALSHTFVAEAGGAARVAGLSIRTICQETAALDAAMVETAIRARDIHYPVTGLIWIEQPSRGFVMPLENMAAVADVGRRHGVPVHMDGARMFNAATYLGFPAAEVVQHADSVMFCVSKGLGAPVGSLLCGNEAFIERARSARKVLGGSMRQAGIIAAGGLFALQHSIERLRDDHHNAQRLAAGLGDQVGLQIDREEVQTNIFFADFPATFLPEADLVAELAKQGIRINAPRGSARTVRFVTHSGVTERDIDVVLERLVALL
jgi:threonine aldolase